MYVCMYVYPLLFFFFFFLFVLCLCFGFCFRFVLFCFVLFYGLILGTGCCLWFVCLFVCLFVFLIWEGFTMHASSVYLCVCVCVCTIMNAFIYVIFMFIKNVIP
ncbi:hypothetical protein TCDM_03258 [Trypanosoma cruzi Dm28c]|uniref:Uncharacterized protein n=1 Tax=Trypanosoma cruzi Dm28c TaxID=1416333 RepID=V5BP53_TRYCR|nr:hypothetical protein TCDM_03258 [Trypanosoma cruzi Dm28c]